MKVKLYDVLWTLGEMSGCHQMPERSFRFRNRQCPVCARCFGAFIGYMVGFITFPFLKIPFWIDTLFCVIMFLDWFIQYKCWKQSSNIRRVITGALCGFGLIQLYLRFIQCIIELI